MISIKQLVIDHVDPTSLDDDTRRREFIFHVLLLATFSLIMVAFVIMLTYSSVNTNYHDEPPELLLVPALILLSLYVVSRSRFLDLWVWCFVALFMLFGTHTMTIYGHVTPEGLLTYVLVIVMTGVLLSTRAAIYVSIIITTCLGVLVYGQSHHFFTPLYKGAMKPPNLANVVLYALFFGAIILVSWLSNREINRSLRRAYRSEQALRLERTVLEDKVRQRSEALEQAHVEKLQELQRFAEFGRLTSSLLHDLANPLTSATLELDQLAGKPTRHTVRLIRSSIRAIELYVDSARRQLRNESEISLFDVAHEIRHVQKFLQSRLRGQGIHCKNQLVEQVLIRGDVVRFNQVIANVCSNAIDAYDMSTVLGKYIAITMKVASSYVIITVEDQGSGIAEHLLPHVFEAFYTTKNSSRGIGIGLAMTKQSVETDFKGTISVTSALGKGTCFTLTLPVS